MMAQQFACHQVEHKLVTVSGAGHGLSKGDPNMVNEAYAEVLPFVNRHLREG